MEKRYQEWQLNPQKYERLLDVRCGTGTNAIEFARRGFQVTGCDIAEDAIRQAKEKAHQANVEVQWLQTDFFTHDWKHPPFPLIIDRGCYHILREIDINRYLRVMDQLTHPRSLFIVLTGSTNYNSEMRPLKFLPKRCAASLGSSFNSKI